MPLRHGAPSPPQLPDSLHRLMKERSRRPLSIFYLDTLIKTGSESIKATLRRRRILFAGFVVRMEDNTRLPKRVMFGELVRGLFGGPGKRADWVFPGRPQSFWHQRRPVDDCLSGRGRMAQDGGTRGGTFVSWRNGLPQRKPGLDYGMQSYART